MTASPIRWDERHGGYWSVTGYQECRAAAGARDGLASSPHVHIPPSGLAKRGLRIYALESDGAEHRQERAVLLDTLGPSASAHFEERIGALARSLLASRDWAAAPDLAVGYAFRLPLEVICDIVAVPAGLRPELRDLTNTLGFRAASEEEAAAAAQRVIEIAGATIASRRAAPPGDWLDTLIAASPDDGSLDAAPARAVVALITSGHHSTSRAIGSLIARILTDPALRALVEQDPGRLPAAAEEVLRLHTPLPSFSRRATADCRIGGTARRRVGGTGPLARPGRTGDPDGKETVMTKHGLEAADRADTFVSHAYPEQLVDLGEVRLNYATAGDPSLPALLLIPGQTESWWGYEQALPLLAERFRCYAVDLRGQGRSSWTPGRYSLDNMGNDLVRFIDAVIGRPTLISGLSSGGVLAAWLSAYARPGQVIAAVWEDPPLFSSELTPPYGPGMRQCVGPLWALYAKWLGDQWSVGDWAGLLRAAPSELPEWAAGLLLGRTTDAAAGPPQNLREYDPEWARAFWTGTVTANCDHARMIAAARVPVLFTHHFRMIDPGTGHLIGAIADEQAAHVRRLVTEAGQPFEYRSFPEQPHPMHQADPPLYARTVIDWATSVLAERAGEDSRADR